MKKPSAEIIEKIQKLLSLAHSSNEHEAKLAAERATGLLTKYNLAMQDVVTADREYEHEDFMSDHQRLKVHQQYLFSLLIEFFFVKVVVDFGRQPGTGKKVRNWSFFGQKHNVEVAKYVYNFLDVTYQSLFTEYVKNGGVKGLNARKSFYMGLTGGLRSQLKMTRSQAEQETGLVVVADPGIDQFMREQIGKTRKMPSTSTTVNREAYSNGIEEGENIKIAKGLGDKNTGKIGETLRIGSAG